MSAGTSRADAVDRRGEVLGVLDGIHDPCSVSIGRPIGLVGMGIIEEVAIDGGVVCVTVLPTFPDCLFRGVFEAEIEKRVSALAWCSTVSVAFAPADQSWDESRLSAEARERLGRRRRSMAEDTPPPVLGLHRGGEGAALGPGVETLVLGENHR